jgi:hypothetical protein
MAKQECVKGCKSIFINFSGAVEELRVIFPKYKTVNSINELSNPTGGGVYVFANGQSFDIAIYGGCPNYVQGECRLKDGCISISS